MSAKKVIASNMGSFGKHYSEHNMSPGKTIASNIDSALQGALELFLASARDNMLTSNLLKDMIYFSKRKVPSLKFTKCIFK